MKHWSIMLASALLLFFIPAVQAHGKPLPPAFGKELVPDESTQERNEARDAEMEEELEKREESVTRRSGGRGGRGGRGGKIHIELDGDEDGGGADDDGL